METEKQPVMRWVGVHNETKFISKPLCYASRYLAFSLQVFPTSTRQALLLNLFFSATGEGCSSYKWLTEANRHRDAVSSTVLCDRNFITKKAWYRFANESGNQMATTCVPMNKCYTHAPGWLNGSHPEGHEGIVTRRVCFHWSNKCCNWETNIRLRNCGPFYSYELTSTPTCQLRYCGE